MNRIYLDNAAATPVDADVYRMMQPFFEHMFGNPSALYAEGVEARAAVEDARGRIARVIEAQKGEIAFMGSGTESDNLAIHGVVRGALKTVSKPHVIVSVIEHPAVLEAARVLEKINMADVTYVGVDERGLVNPKDVQDALRDTTVLVSVMYANSEVGTVQPIKEIVRVVREYRGSRELKYPYVHTDACQAVNFLPISVEKLSVDLMTFNASKIYGPKGVGVLYVRKGIRAIVPLVFGGGQEHGLRSGTENVAGIVGCAAALEKAESMKESEVERLSELRDYFIKKLEEQVEGSVINGDRELRLANNVHVTIPGMEEDVLVIELDARGVACSSKSACKSSSEGGSHVLAAMGVGTEGSSLRFSLGRDTTREDVDYTGQVLCDILEKYKGLRT
jgi:cysteine desulfurase